MTTLDKINALLDAKSRTRIDDWGDARLNHVPKVICADGFTMSVQASSSHYCSPRDNEGPYVSVEIGFPSERVEEFMDYIDGNRDDTDPTDTVYGWVPVHVVVEVIDQHGGLV